MPSSRRNAPSDKPDGALFFWGGLSATAAFVGLYSVTHQLFGVGPHWYDGLWQGWAVPAGVIVGGHVVRKRRRARAAAE